MSIVVASPACNLLVKGNDKLGDKVYHFSLPAGSTCRPSKWCLTGRNGKPACYALRNRFVFSTVQDRLEANKKASLRDDFAERVIDQLERVRTKMVRWHVSGDFYSRRYIAAVKEIAVACSNTLFRTTTRRSDFTAELQDLNSLPNFTIRESLDPTRSCPVMGLPFAATDSTLLSPELAKTAFVCPGGCPKCHYQCWKSDRNVIFPEH